MKKITGMVLGCLCSLCVLCFQATESLVQAQGNIEKPNNLYARSAVLMDADSGRILLGKEEDKVSPMASTTKIMTCILALEHMEEKQIANVSDYAVCQPKVRLGVKKGDRFYIKDLLYSLMLESHNDSAVVIAEAISGTVEDFVELMNKKADELGLQNTHFVTPNGLDGEDEGGVHATTAAELAEIMRYCIMKSEKKEDFLEITRTKQYSFTDLEGNRNFSCRNHNAFLDMMDGAIAGKTGFTADAGYCYVGALRRKDRTFIVALLACGWPNNKGYKWKDTRRLMEYGISNYEYRDISKRIGKIPIPVRNGADSAKPFTNTLYVYGIPKMDHMKLCYLLRDDEAEKVTVKICKDPGLSAPVKKGQKIGSVLYQLDGNTLYSFPLTAVDSVEERNLKWCFLMAVRQICL